MPRLPLAEPAVWTRADLIRAGLNRRAIDTHIADGRLIRARTDRYLPANAPSALVHAVRVGGHLTCTSLLALHGIFVQGESGLHVALPAGASRLRSPTTSSRRLAANDAHLHWSTLLDPPGQDRATVSVRDALVHAMTCQPPRRAVASLDSALHLRAIDHGDLADIAAMLPRRLRRLLGLADGRAESGPETLARLLLRALGCRVELQVFFDGIGRVDIVVDDWLVIECDSREFHSSWESQAEDRRRDAALARRGYVSLRFLANDIMWRPEVVISAVRGLMRRYGRRG